MRILLDENIPVQALDIVRQTLPAHKIDHVLRRKGSQKTWKSKKDKFLIPDMAQAGYDALVTLDSNQLSDPDETRLIRKSGIHHIRCAQGDGLKGLARGVGSLVASMPEIVDELMNADGQRLVRIPMLAGGQKRHVTVDPSKNPPAYWKR